MSADRPTEAQHTPTPWLCRLVRWTPDSPVGGFGIFAEGRRRLICGNGIVDPGNGHEPFMSGGELEANAERIVACVNAHDAILAEVRALREALDNLVNAPALSGIADLVRGWSGKPDDPNPRHPSNLGAQIKTTCGRVYQLDEALTAARAALGTGDGNKPVGGTP